MRFANRWLTVLGCVALTAFAGARALAQSGPQPADTQPEWPEETVGLLRDFFERVDVEAVLDGVRAPRPVGIETSPAEVAAHLGPSWESPFRFVSTAISYEPYPGRVRGARGTLIAGAGNSLDQALLLAEIYRSRGQRARLVRGTLPWDAAVGLVGAAKVERVERGDPWLRWVEIASDHWWVEVERAGSWVQLDPSFRGGTVSDSHGRRRQVVDEVLQGMQSVTTVEVLVAGDVDQSVTVPTAKLAGSSVLLRLHKEVPVPREAPLESPVPVVSLDAATDARRGPLPQEVPADPLDSVLPVLPEGPRHLDLQVGDRTLSVTLRPETDLTSVTLQIRVRSALGGRQSLTIPWQGGSDARLFVHVHPGRVQPEVLRRHAARVYELLATLTSAELDALQAFEARPQPDPELADGVIAGATRSRRAPRLPPPGSGAAVPDPAVDVPLHPADVFHVALVRAWLDFEADGLPALAASYLAAVDRLRPDVPVVGTGVRLVGVSWVPPTAEHPGAVAVWSSEPVAVGGAESHRRRGLQGAFGLLESALLGHVLNGFADAPPATAFDLTLRSVGSGSRLGWWRRGSRLPQSWPAAARATATAALGAGYTVIAPRVPPSRDGGPLGWWELAPRSGTMTGVVANGAATAQGTVEFSEPGTLRDFGSLLASVRHLHRSARWLIAAADPKTSTVAALLPRACAATSLVGELLVAGAPRDWQPPLFAGYCAGARPLP